MTLKEIRKLLKECQGGKLVSDSQQFVSCYYDEGRTMRDMVSIGTLDTNESYVESSSTKVTNTYLNKKFSDAKKYVLYKKNPDLELVERINLNSIIL